MNEAMPQDETIDGFQNLQHLAIHHCSLTGRIPTWLSKLTRLKVLVLSKNQLTGPMPSWINSLNHLFRLDVSNNSLTGEKPITLMQMPMFKSDKAGIYSDPSLLDIGLLIYAADPSKLQYRINSDWCKVLNLGNNKFTGVIPQEIGQLKALLYLNLGFNNFHGEIPQSSATSQTCKFLICRTTSSQVKYHQPAW